jgi:hypothetical protein
VSTLKSFITLGLSDLTLGAFFDFKFLAVLGLIVLLVVLLWLTSESATLGYFNSI